MYRKRSVFFAAFLLVLALLPVAAAMSVPSTGDLRLGSALTLPLAAVTSSFGRSATTDGWDLGVMTAVGLTLFGLAAVVRKTTRT